MIDANSGIVLNFVAKTFPGYTIHHHLRRQLRQIHPDQNNFQSADELRSLLLSYDIISFDYFDTLASRSVSLPAIQDMTARYGATLIATYQGEFSKTLLRHSRQWFSEQLKRYYMSLPAEHYRNEVELGDLLDNAMRPYLPDAIHRKVFAEAVVAHEVGIEKLVLEPHDDFRSLLKFLKRNGKTLVLTSDMYLSRSDMIEILKHQDLYDFFDYVFVSSTSGVTKNSGKLFTLIDKTLKLKGERRIHLGDNYTNDYVRPKECGWEALHYFQSEHEKRRQTLAFDYSLGRSTEKARFEAFLKIFLNGEPPDALRLLSAGFAVFARRLVDRAMRNKIDTLYFLTRDGTVFGEIVEEYITSVHGRGLLADIELGVLALNRRTGVILTYPGIKDRSWLEFNVDYLNETPISLRTIMKTFAVKVEDLKGLTKRESRLVTRCLEIPQRIDLSMENLAKRPNIQNSLDDALLKKKEQARRYLEQKGVLDAKKSIILADVGYSGTILKNLSNLFFEEQVKNMKMEDTVEVGARIDLCMFANNRFLEGNLGQMHPKCRVDAGMVIDTSSPSGRAASINFSWLEPFCLDRSLGSLRGYQEDKSGTMEPVFDAVESDPAFRELRHDILASARDYFDLSAHANMDLDRLDSMIVEKMTRAFSYPSTQTVSLVKKHLHDVGKSGSKKSIVVRKLSRRRLYRELRNALGSDKWVQGSLRESGLSFLIPALNFVISKAQQ